MTLPFLAKATIQEASKERFITNADLLLYGKVDSMCEFKVILNGETMFKDAVNAKAKGSGVIIRDILGQSKEFKNCRILEVDVNSTRLILSSP